MVFITSVREFVFQGFLGGPETLIIGKVLWYEFLCNRYFPVAFAMDIIVLAILLLPILIFHHYRS